jgi:hypothetical protein
VIRAIISPVWSTRFRPFVADREREGVGDFVCVARGRSGVSEVCPYRRLGRGAVTITGGLPDVSGATSCIAASPPALSAQGFLIARQLG